MKPEHRQPTLGRNPNRIEPSTQFTPQRPSSQLSGGQHLGGQHSGQRGSGQIDPRQTSVSRQTGVWQSAAEQDALKTGVWNPSRQAEAPSVNRWVLLAVVAVCSLSSFAVFKSLIPAGGARVISARSSGSGTTTNRIQALPPAVATSPNSANSSSANPSSANASTANQSEADQVAASAVTFDRQESTIVETTPVTGQTKPVAAPTGSLPANQIRLEQIDSIGGTGSTPVLHFKDGSSLNVDAFTLQQLPADVRLRVTYSRGNDAP
jgi:hypothetical protein